MIIGCYRLTVTTCLHTGHFWNYYVLSNCKKNKTKQKNKQEKALQTCPKSVAQSFIFHYSFLLLWELHTLLLTFIISFMNHYLHLSLHTVKYLFPIEYFYLLLKYVFKSNNINSKTCINTTVFCDAIFLVYLQYLWLVRWFSLKQLEKAVISRNYEQFNQLRLFWLSAFTFCYP